MAKRKALAITAALLVAGGIYGMNTPTITTPAATAKPTAVATATPRPATVRPSAVVSLAQQHGYYPSISEDRGPLRCDYTLDSTQRATVVWTDGVQAYSISGAYNDIGLLYEDMLKLEDWQSCRYNVKDHARCGYGDGAKVADLSDTLNGYTKAFLKASGVKPTPAPTPVRYQYVLNNERKMFHWPSCPSAKRLKGKKRQEVTTSRDQLIAKGYEPCGNCNP